MNFANSRASFHTDESCGDVGRIVLLHFPPKFPSGLEIKFHLSYVELKLWPLHLAQTIGMQYS